MEMVRIRQETLRPFVEKEIKNCGQIKTDESVEEKSESAAIERVLSNRYTFGKVKLTLGPVTCVR